MASLDGKAIDLYYKDLLQVSNSASGVDGTTRTVSDGEGTASALQISSTVVNVNGTFKVGGSTITLPAAFTISGAYAGTFTFTNTTNVTFPTTGTLATIAGSETLTNKTLTSPTLTAPILGTVASGNISTCTSTSMVMVTPLLGTPTSGVLTNCTGLVPATGLSSVTGTGAAVLATSPTIASPTMTAPVLGVATATSINFGGNALNTYTTGSWTPVLKFGGATTGITYAAQTGEYTRIGNIVYFTCNIQLSSKGSATGTAIISGLPVAAVDGNQFLSIGYTQSLTFGTTTNSVPVANPVSTTVMNLYYQTTSTSVAALDNTGFANATAIIFNGFYFSS